MTVRRILIFTPILIILLLLQSYLWVPTYEEQTRGNPKRLNDYITGSIGDASILNPILNSDSASADITAMVFEGLIDRDEDLRFRGRLATSWEIHEEAFFYVNEKTDIPGMGKARAGEVVKLLKEAKTHDLATDPKLKACLDNIREISILPTREFIVTRQVQGWKEQKGQIELRIRVKAPDRIKLHLYKVDQDLFTNLSRILGQDYFRSFPATNYLSIENSQLAIRNSQLAEELIPATEHNPIVVFHLRPHVKFHDGHVFDAYDVKFTYEAIMNPKNLSPRVSDYEPVKRVDVLDSLTVRVVYKRLYSPALGTWGIGILPEHLLNEKALKEEALRLGKDPEKFSMRQSNFYFPGVET
jgi:ABC-type transport system substrate-binding protein